MTIVPLLQLAPANVAAEPFPYFTVSQGFPPQVSSLILEWLTAEAPWVLIETNFYEQYEINLSGSSAPPHLAFLTKQPFLDDLRSKAEHAFSVSLGNRVDCTAHKLVSGQRIRIHNDFIPGEETHRVLVQLNCGWTEEQGGFLVFFNSEDPTDIHAVFQPIHNSVVGFAISEISYHAVSTIHAGERYTLVFSFYRSDND